MRLDNAPEGLAAGHEVWLMREDLHELGAFKWRGALRTLTGHAEQGAGGVVTASTGNHGAATAWAARQLGLQAVVYVPAAASAAKLALLGQLGATLRQTGADLDEAKEAARAFAEGEDLPFFEDGAEPAQYEGYGAIADELLDQAPTEPAAVVVPVGNGALMVGVGARLAERSPRTLRVGVVAGRAPVMALSWEAGEPVECELCDSFADGLAVRVAIPRAVELLDSAAQRMLAVSEREIAAAVAAYDRAGIRAEGAAAAALAALPQLSEVEGPIALIVTGRNIDDELLRRAVERPESFPA